MADAPRCLTCGGTLITVAGLQVHATPPPNDHLAVPPASKQAGGDVDIRQRIAEHTLPDDELMALRIIRAVRSSPRVITWSRQIADKIRLACPTVDDATLAHVVMQVLGISGRHAYTHDLTAAQANDLLARAAVELAGLELDNPLADEPGDGKT